MRVEKTLVKQSTIQIHVYWFQFEGNLKILTRIYWKLDYKSVTLKVQILFILLGQFSNQGYVYTAYRIKG